MLHQQERESIGASSNKQVEVAQESVTMVLGETNEVLRGIQKICDELDARTMGESPPSPSTDSVTSGGMVALAFEARSQARAIMEFLGKFKERL